MNFLGKFNMFCEKQANHTNKNLNVNIFLWLSIVLFIIHNSISWSQYTVDFETSSSGNKGGYASGNVTLNGIQWNLTQALIGSLSNDKKNGSRSMRMRRSGSTPGSATMLADKTGGVGTISFQYARYGNETGQPNLFVEYSTNGGSTWTQAGTTITSFPASLTTWTATINQTGNVRIRFRTNTGGTNERRFNIDDIVLTDYSAATPLITVSPSTISGINYAHGNGPSDSQTFTVSGTNLTNNIVVNAPSNYEVSTNGTSFFNSRTLNQSGGTVNPTTIYVRLKENLAINSYNQSVQITSTGATTRNVSLSGEVLEPIFLIYEFTGNSVSPTQQPSDATTSNFQVSNGNVTFGTVGTWAGSGTPYAQSNGGWGQTSVENAKNFNFNVITDEGFVINASNISFEWRTTGAGPSAITVEINGTEVATFNSGSNAQAIFNQSLSGFENQNTLQVVIKGWDNGSRSTSGGGDFRVNDVRIDGEIVVGEPCADPTWHYQTISSGSWINGAIWEASPNGSTGWVSANCPPDATAQTITIRAGHEVNVTDNLTIDQTTIEENAVLNWTSGNLTIANGPGDDLTVFGKFRHNRSASAPYNAGATIRVKTDGVLEVNNNATSASHYGTSNQIFYEDKAVFYWNLSSTAFFTTANATYFPNAAANEIPIFRTRTPNLTIGAGSVTRINGYFEVEQNTITWQNGGDKIFRNGLGGNGNIIQASSSGRFFMDGDTAFIAGSGNINLHSGERLQTDGAVYVKLLSDKAINGGQLRITNPSTLDTQEFELSGSAQVRLNNRATLRIQHPNGVDGAIGQIGSVNFVSDREQTVIFERNGPQNSGINHLPNSLGAIEIRNGSVLLLEKDMEISELSAGYFLIDGAGSQLRVTDDIDLNINGNRSFILQNGGSMHDDCLDHLRFFTGGNSSTGTFTGNGETIKCWNFNSSKSNSGGVILENNTPLTCKNNLDLALGGTATFIDNGNTITVGDDLRLGGSSNNNYNFTGTIIMNGVGSGGTSTIQNGSDAIVAHLNNLTINPPAGRPAVQFNPQTGTQNITIKGDLNIISGDVSLYGNNYLLNGDFSNTANLISGTSTVVFDNTNTDQNINGNVTTFYNLKLAKPGQILEMNEDVNVTNEVQLADGGVLRLNQFTLNLGSTGKLMNEDDDNYVFCSCPSAQIVAEGFISANTPANLGNLGLTINPEIDMEHTQIVRMHEPKNLGDGTSIARIYTVSPTVNADLNATLELQFFTHEKNGLNTELLTFFRSPDGGTTWNEIGGSFDDETNLLTVTEWQHFSPITGGEGNPSALPVALVYFNSECNTNQVTLNWQTASEWNASHFEIEKSNDGANWNIIGKVNAQGTSNQLVDYSFTDIELNRGQINYYRLVQVDFDGEYEVFGPISGTCKSSNDEISISVFPNPTSRNSALDVTSNEEKKAAISVQSSTGQVIHSTTVQLTQGFNQFTIPSNDWADGVYIIILQPEYGMPFTTKLIKN